MLYSQSLFLLFSYELDKKKKIDFSKGKLVKNIILENQFKKEKNNYIIELYEIKVENNNFFFLVSPYINIKINNYDLNLNINKDEKFIFNEKKDLNANCLTIEEEFNFYYKFIKKDKDNSKKLLDSLIKSIFRILKENKEHSTFSLLLTIITEEEINKNINAYDIESLLLNTEKKGDISKININEFFSKNKNLFFQKKKHPFIYFYFLYNLLANGNKLEFLLDNIEERNFIFDCLDKFKKLLKNYIKIIPAFSFLIDAANSCKELHNILFYIKNLSEFIFLLNDKKKHIFQLIFENEKDFNIEHFIEQKDDIFNEKFDESFYFSLISINEYILNKYKGKKIIGFKRGSNSGDFIRFNLFNFFFSNEICDKNSLMDYIFNHSKKNLNECNNMEIFGLICIFYPLKDKQVFPIIDELIRLLNNRKISDECIKYLKKIDFNKKFEEEDIIYYVKTISFFIKRIFNIKLFEFLFNIMEKMINQKREHFEEIIIKIDFKDKNNKNSNKEEENLRGKENEKKEEKEKEDIHENKEIMKQEEKEQRREYDEKDKEIKNEIRKNDINNKNINMKIEKNDYNNEEMDIENERNNNENKENNNEKKEIDDKKNDNKEKDKAKIYSENFLQIEYIPEIQEKILFILAKQKIFKKKNL